MEEENGGRLETCHTRVSLITAGKLQPSTAIITCGELSLQTTCSGGLTLG